MSEHEFEDGLGIENPEVSTTRETTPLDRLKSVLKTEASQEPVTLKVPIREGIAVKFDTNIATPQIDHWQKRSVRKVSGKNTYDPVRFAAFVIAAKAISLILDGKPVVDDDGEPIRLVSSTIREFLGLADGSDPTAIVRALYGSDGSIVTTSDAILAAAGYGGDPDDLIQDEQENPTTER